MKLIVPCRRTTSQSRYPWKTCHNTVWHMLPRGTPRGYTGFPQFELSKWNNKVGARVGELVCFSRCCLTNSTEKESKRDRETGWGVNEDREREREGSDHLSYERLISPSCRPWRVNPSREQFGGTFQGKDSPHQVRGTCQIHRKGDRENRDLKRNWGTKNHEPVACSVWRPQAEQAIAKNK